MYKLAENELYREDLKRMAKSRLSWDRLADVNVLITGATGLIGRNMIDLLMYMNEKEELSCHITALSRNEDTAHMIFPERYFMSGYFSFFPHDICNPLPERIMKHYDYVIHLASNTHPAAYAQKPIDTIWANISGAKNLLDLCAAYRGSRFVFPSSVEIYGENRKDTELFDEKYMGYLDANTLRAGYPESKRLCEALCQAYISEKSVDCAIARLPRVFGPTMGENDSKAVAQFIKKAVWSEDIVLKSEGTQNYSFLYVPDAVTGILTIMLCGTNGQEYNIADEGCDGTLREAAEICALIGGVRVTRDTPDEIEKKGYSTATKARLDGRRIKSLGWQADYTLKQGLERTISILKQAAKGDNER